MRRISAVIAAVTLSAGLLSGCGGDDAQAFCESGSDLESFSPENGDQLNDALDEAVDNAPSEIEDDVEKLRDYIQDLQDAEGDPEKMAELSTDTDLTAASQNVQEWVEENCG